MVDMMKRYGEEGWFGLGDRDLATNILRTHRLAQGVLLSTITAQFAAALGITAALLPMTDQPVATMVETLEHGLLSFQEYFVRYRWQPTVTRLQYAGIENAVAAPGVLAALENADAIIFCPSNPLLSVEPILRIGAIRNAIEKRRTPCLAISPIVAGAALKGPAAKLMGELQLDPSAAGVAAYYGDLIDGFVIDNQDSDLAPALAGRVFVSDIIMRDVADRARLANEVLAWVKELAS
jgi:LPPG:FO 2-phospho-L-lactate transferase